MKHSGCTVLCKAADPNKSSVIQTFIKSLPHLFIKIYTRFCWIQNIRYVPIIPSLHHATPITFGLNYKKPWQSTLPALPQTLNHPVDKSWSVFWLSILFLNESFSITFKPERMACLFRKQWDSSVDICMQPSPPVSCPIASPNLNWCVKKSSVQWLAVIVWPM